MEFYPRLISIASPTERLAGHPGCRKLPRAHAARAGDRRGGARPSLGGRWRGGCGGRFISKAPDGPSCLGNGPVDLFRRGRAKRRGGGRHRHAPSRGRGQAVSEKVQWTFSGLDARSAGRSGPGGSWARRGAPEPGGALSGRLWWAVYLESPGRRRGGGRHRHAPSRGEGRARPGLVARAKGRASVVVTDASGHGADEHSSAHADERACADTRRRRLADHSAITSRRRQNIPRATLAGSSATSSSRPSTSREH